MATRVFRLTTNVNMSRNKIRVQTTDQVIILRQSLYTYNTNNCILDLNK